MDTITTKDGTSIYYKDWERGPVVTFSRGGPLSADAWTHQCCFSGSRVIVSSPMIVAATDVRARFGKGTIWINTPTIWPNR